jgi:hypothetical protein
MVYQSGKFVLCKKTLYWFYREDRIPKYAEPCDLPEGYDVSLKSRNKYPFLKRVKCDPDVNAI